MPGPTADVAAVLYHSAVAQSGDLRSACLALIGAAGACHEGLRAGLPPGVADDLLAVLSVAGGLLIDDSAAPLDLATPAGTA